MIAAILLNRLAGLVIEAIAIVVMTLATIAAAATQLAPRVAPGRLIYGLEPDRPHPFGYRMAWLAIRTRETRRVIDLLGLTAVEPTNWNTGLGTVYSAEFSANQIFVSPPVDGWTFVVGLPLPQPLGPAFVDKSMALLTALGERFSEVQYYFAYAPIEFYAWARIVEGRLLRAFAVGDEGVLWNMGKQPKEEKLLNLAIQDLRKSPSRKAKVKSKIALQPTENHVIRLAAAWSIDPTRIDAHDTAPALGYIGVAPRYWRAELALKRAA